MKNASKYADAIRSLMRSLLKEGKPAPMPKMDPLKALVRGAMSANVSDARAEETMKLIDREFVNLNELRVATELEAQELLGSKFPGIEQRVAMLAGCLNAIFEKEHTLSLDRLKGVSKKDARQFLRELPGVSPFVEAYVMMFGFEGGGFPLDNEMLEYLRGEGIFDARTSVEDAQKFLEQHLKAEECYDFYALLRRAVYEKARKKVRS